jgi:hypothetical protein
VGSLFAGRTLSSMQETQLTGIMDINQVNKYNWKTDNDVPPPFRSTKDNGFVVTMNPLDLRTWIIKFN